MPTISADADLVTLINTFTSAPEDREQVVAALRRLGPLAAAAPGFVSASIHVSLDGTRIVNYVQWRSAADVESFISTPLLQEGLAALRGIAEVDPRLYRVAQVVEPATGAGAEGAADG